MNWRMKTLCCFRPQWVRWLLLNRPLSMKHINWDWLCLIVSIETINQTHRQQVPMLRIPNEACGTGWVPLTSTVCIRQPFVRWTWDQKPLWDNCDLSWLIGILKIKWMLAVHLLMHGKTCLVRWSTPLLWNANPALRLPLIGNQDQPVYTVQQKFGNWFLTVIKVGH